MPRPYSMKTNIKLKSFDKKVEEVLAEAALGIAAGVALAPELGKKFYSEIKKKSAKFRVELGARSDKMHKMASEAKKSWKKINS